MQEHETERTTEPINLRDFFCAPSPGTATYYRNLPAPGKGTQLLSLPRAQEDSQAFGFVTENLPKAEIKNTRETKPASHCLSDCSVREEMLWLNRFPPRLHSPPQPSNLADDLVQSPLLSGGTCSAQEAQLSLKSSPWGLNLTED